MKILSIILIAFLFSCSAINEPESGYTDSLWVFVHSGDVESIKLNTVELGYDTLVTRDTTVDSTQNIVVEREEGSIIDTIELSQIDTGLMREIEEGTAIIVDSIIIVETDVKETIDITEEIEVIDTKDIDLNSSIAEDPSGEARTSYKFSVDKGLQLAVKTKPTEYEYIDDDETLTTDSTIYTVYNREDYNYAKWFAENNNIEDTTVEQIYKKETLLN